MHVNPYIENMDTVYTLLLINNTYLILIDIACDNSYELRDSN